MALRLRLRLDEQLKQLELKQLAHLGHRGDSYPTDTKPKAYRQVRIYEGPSDSFVVAMSNCVRGRASQEREAEILRDELARRGFPVPGSCE
jgi:hypothetical protein